MCLGKGTLSEVDMEGVLIKSRKSEVASLRQGFGW